SSSLGAEAGDAGRVRRAAECELQEEARRADREEIDRDTYHDLVCAELDRARPVKKREQKPSPGARDYARPATPAAEASQRGAQATAEHVSLERESDEACALGHHAACCREEKRDGDAQRLGEEGEKEHSTIPFSVRAAPRAPPPPRR